MKNKHLATMLILFALSIAIASAIVDPQSNQKTLQNASQAVMDSKINNTTINQSMTQKTIQSVSSMKKPVSPAIKQSTEQNANQSIQDVNLRNATINQNLMQTTNQNVTWNVQNYFAMNTQKTIVTSEQRTILVTRTHVES